MSVTIHAFPPLHAFTSARSWFLAIIVLLHVGFFWALSSGLTPSFTTFIPNPLIAEFVPEQTRTLPPPPPPPSDPIVRQELLVPVIEVPNLAPTDVDTAPRGDDMPPAPTPPSEAVFAPRSTLTQPQIDPRRGLSEPLYPAHDIRAGNTGTVLLSVYVLENGRVGEVKLEQSSGHQSLDESALREARKWRFKPGMRDGTPVAMWKQVPITFQLRE